MIHSSKPFLHGLLGLVLLVTAGGCGAEKRPDDSAKAAPAQADEKQAAAEIVFGAYTTPREAYGTAILPAFKKRVQASEKVDLAFRESYLASGAQARAIIGGFDADVAALSLEPDIDQLEKAGLVKHDWKVGEHAGMVTRSVVVIGVRKGNPKKILTWQDLARPGVEVLTPNVRTSGGAMWNVLAIYGAAIRGHAGTKAGDEAAAVALLASIFRNVKIMDRGARDSMLTFERGIGDAIITYENEILVGRKGGKDYDYVAPSSTILIENPVAVVDANVDKHKSRKLTKDFVDFLFTPEAQRAFAKYGLRPVDAGVAKETESQFAKVSDLFTIRDLGDWEKAQELLFAKGGIYDKALAEAQEKGK